MNITEMITEWRKGCCNTRGAFPESCPECTVALINAIERKAAEQEQDAGGRTMTAPDDSIIEAVSFFRKACVEFGMSPSKERLAYMLNMQKALFAVIEQPSPAAERDGYATGGFITERPLRYGEDFDAAFKLELLASLDYFDEPQ